MYAPFPVRFGIDSYRDLSVISVPIGSFVAGLGFGKEITCMSSVTNFEGDFNDWLIGGDRWRC